ncbi:zinc ribbon domain-containing protein [Haloimpatiens sp. FM7330]|uniref:zinc ribbon domain-containing protein n=1 Tax=Haloimpatiens sp. FM7330 TaxID=3298610 RepID=UPI003633F75E
MKILDKIIKLEKCYTKLEENMKILKDKSKIILLKKMQKEYENVKKSNIEIGTEIQKIEKEYSEIEENVLKKKEEKKQQEELLYDGNVGCNIKFIDNVQSKIENLQNEIDKLEEEKSVLLDNEESLLNQKQKIEDDMKSVKTNFYEFKEEVLKEIQNAKIEIKSGNEQIQALRDSMSEEVLNKFDYIRRVRKPAVASVEDGVCQGCKIALPSMILDDIVSKRKKELICCDSCGRILYCKNTEKIVKKRKSRKKKSK